MIHIIVFFWKIIQTFSTFRINFYGLIFIYIKNKRFCFVCVCDSVINEWEPQQSY